MSQALLALDTDHIKRYVFGTSKLKEIRGASSRLDYLNRQSTVRIAEGEAYRATTIYALGGSALFLLESDRARQLGQTIQRLYQKETGGSASITYAIQPLPASNYSRQQLLTATRLDAQTTMKDVLKLLRYRLRLVKDGQRPDLAESEESAEYLSPPSHVLLSPCNSCGIAYAEKIWRDNDDAQEPEGLYCLACIKKRRENSRIRTLLNTNETSELSQRSFWGKILAELRQGSSYRGPLTIPQDFHGFRELSLSKGYIGLIYADANGMGQHMENMQTLQEIQKFSVYLDKTIYQTLGEVIRAHLPAQGEKLPFDILLVGGDDIMIVTPADKALLVAATLVENFRQATNQQHTLSVGVLLAPLSYPFPLQHKLVEEALKEAKGSGATVSSSTRSQADQSRVNFLVVTGNTSLDYGNICEGLSKKVGREEFYATMRPYTLPDFTWLLEQIQLGHEKRLGRTKLHQLREAILKQNRTSSILEALALLRNWQEEERHFVKQLVKKFDTHRTWQQQQQETLFPWYLDGSKNRPESAIYSTPLLDFIELYDFVNPNGAPVAAMRER